jgi:two-component system chemotaxis response regulator CheY
MRIALQTTTLTLIEAVDGQDALEKILNYHPDLILLDLFMPRLDGFGVLEAVRATPTIRHIPIIVLSAWPTGDNQKRTRLAGASGFVAKPYDPLKLVKLLKDTLASSLPAVYNKNSTNAAESST